MGAKARQREPQGLVLTVAVISAEHTSQTYLTPPSVPRMAVFFLMRPMVSSVAVGTETKWEYQEVAHGALPRRFLVTSSLLTRRQERY